MGEGDRQMRQSAGPAGHGGDMTPLDRTLLGTDRSMAAIDDDPFTLTALIFDAQAQLPIHLATAAEQITANGTHADARGCLDGGDAQNECSYHSHQRQHDPQPPGSRRGAAQGWASGVAGGTGSSWDLAPGVSSAPSSPSPCGWNHSHT
jgi:hypothetical protein